MEKVDKKLVGKGLRASIEDTENIVPTYNPSGFTIKQLESLVGGVTNAQQTKMWAGVNTLQYVYEKNGAKFFKKFCEKILIGTTEKGKAFIDKIYKIEGL